MGRRTTWLAVLSGWLGVAFFASCGDDSEPGVPELGIPLPNRSPPDSGDKHADAGPVACDTKKGFEAPMLVPGLDQGGFLQVPRLSPDERTIYLTSLAVVDGASQVDLARAVRPTRDDPFGPVVPVTALDTLAVDKAAMLAS